VTGPLIANKTLVHRRVGGPAPGGALFSCFNADGASVAGQSPSSLDTGEAVVFLT